MQAETNPNEDTEFNDALRAHGILPPKPEPERSPSPENHEIKKQERLKKATIEDLDEEIDNVQFDEKEEEELLELRRKRLKDLIKEENSAKFGRIYPISRQDYTREVTEASKEDGVVCFLYNDSEESKLLKNYLEIISKNYPKTKFTSIIGNKCIENYPDKNLPTMLIYKNNQLHRQIIGLRPEIGLDGLNTKMQDIELLLIAIGVIEKSKIPKKEKEKDQEEEEKEKSNIRNSNEDLDDDLDWD